MNDKNIQELVKMAMEIEALERAGESGDASSAGATEPIAAIAGGHVVHERGNPAPHWGRRLMVGVGFGTAAAACLTVAMLAMRPVTPKVVPGPMVATSPDEPRHEAAAPIVAVKAEKEECVVMTMYREPDGRCSCVKLEQQPEWNQGKKLAEVPRSELYEVALRSPCSTSAPQALIVAVAGDGKSLPKNRQQAEVLAQQVSSAAASVGQHADVSALAYAAMGGLSAGSTVIAENVSMRQVSRARDLAPAGMNWR